MINESNHLYLCKSPIYLEILHTFRVIVLLFYYAKMCSNEKKMFDILPPPLEKIDRGKKKESVKKEGIIKNKEEHEKCNEKSFVISDNRNKIDENKITNIVPNNKLINERNAKIENPNDKASFNEVAENIANEVKKRSSYVSEKYKNVILNSEEINTIMSNNDHFKNLVQSKKINDFMNDYLKNPIESIKKYQNDTNILKFLELLFQYMNAKGNHEHLNNLENNFTFPKK